MWPVRRVKMCLVTRGSLLLSAKRNLPRPDELSFLENKTKQEPKPLLLKKNCPNRTTKKSDCSEPLYRSKKTEVHGIQIN